MQDLEGGHSLFLEPLQVRRATDTARDAVHVDDVPGGERRSRLRREVRGLADADLSAWADARHVGALRHGGCVTEVDVRDPAGEGHLGGLEGGPVDHDWLTRDEHRVPRVRH